MGPSHFICELTPDWSLGPMPTCLHVSLCPFRNGQSLGVAFSNIKMGPGIAYFPAISLSFKESVAFNFGSRPLRYPYSIVPKFTSSPYRAVSSLFDRSDIVLRFSKPRGLLCCESHFDFLTQCLSTHSWGTLQAVYIFAPLQLLVNLNQIIKNKPNN